MKTATQRWMTLAIVLLLAAAGPATAQQQGEPTAAPNWKPETPTGNPFVVFSQDESGASPTVKILRTRQRDASEALQSAQEMYSRLDASLPLFWTNQGMMSEKQSKMLEQEMPRVHEAVKALAALEGDSRRGRSGEGRRVVRDLLRKVSELKEKNSAQYEEEKPSLEIAALAHLTDLETEVRAAGVRGTPQGAEREKLAAELRTSLEKALDLKEQVKAHEAELIERELKAIRAMLEQRRRNRAQILERRLLQLLDEDELAW